jgi:hypothetical protein
MVNSDFVNPVEKLLDLQWCIPALENSAVKFHTLNSTSLNIPSLKGIVRWNAWNI